MTMKKTLTTIGYIVLGIAVFAIFSVLAALVLETEEDSAFPAEPEIPAQEPLEAPTAVPTPEPTPEPAPSPVAAPGADLGLGDDSYLNELAQRCADGNIDACDSLYWESPIDSDYETFGFERGSVGSELGVLALDLVWDGMSQAERDEICNGVDLAGAEWGAEIISDSSDGSITVEAAVEWLEGTCG